MPANRERPRRGFVLLAAPSRIAKRGLFEPCVPLKSTGLERALCGAAAQSSIRLALPIDAVAMQRKDHARQNRSALAFGLFGPERSGIVRGEPFGEMPADAGESLP